MPTIIEKLINQSVDENLNQLAVDHVYCVTSSTKLHLFHVFLLIELIPNKITKRDKI